MSEEEVTKIDNTKKTASYTYWVDENNRSRQLPEQHRPKKLQQPVVVEQEPVEGPSKWNKLGSWQQKTIPNSQLQEVAEKAIKEWLTSTKSQLILKSVSFNGEFKRIFSNQKKRVLYEISGSIKFQSDQSLEISLEDISCTGDRDFSIKGKKKQEKEALVKASNNIIDLIVKEFNKYKE